MRTYAAPLFCLFLVPSMFGAEPASKGDQKKSFSRVAAEVLMDSARRRVEPEYPIMAKKMGVEGDVLLDVSVDASGAVAGAERISGNPVLAHAASTAVLQWRFKPVLINDHPTAVVGRMKFEFKP